MDDGKSRLWFTTKTERMDVKKTFCDLCKSEIHDWKELRYVRIIKLKREFSDSEPEEAPDMREKEVCSICTTRLKDLILSTWKA